MRSGRPNPASMGVAATRRRAVQTASRLRSIMVITTGSITASRRGKSRTASVATAVNGRSVSNRSA
jgi:hypothetical protein